MEARSSEESILPASPREIGRALSFTIDRHLPDRLIRLHKPLFDKSIWTKHDISDAEVLQNLLYFLWEVGSMFFVNAW